MQADLLKAYGCILFIFALVLYLIVETISECISLLFGVINDGLFGGAHVMQYVSVAFLIAAFVYNAAVESRKAWLSFYKPFSKALKGE